MTRSLVIAACLASATAARADIARYAVVIGNNTGDRGDAPLRHAERDAQRFASALIDLGGFPAANVVVLQESDAEAVRATVIAINDRIRSGRAPETMLVVYYSGHADAGALHLGRTQLAIEQLEQLVRGSAATFRLLAVDACRSGVLTRVKGASLAPPIPIVVGETLAADGVVFWTASAATEDAQESDEIQGSFFTHYLVSGLAGPADVNGDGKVTTGEAFEHARAATLRASSRTLAGPQHATFRNEVRGRSDVALTTPATAGRMAVLELPPGRDALVMAHSASGAVVGEIGIHDRVRRLAVRPGRYFIRQRAEAYLLEGTVVVAAGTARLIADRELARVAYATLVRKGGRGRQDGLEVGLAARSGLLAGDDPCAGLAVGYTLALASVTLGARVHACRERLATPIVATTLLELTAAARAAHVWDLGRTSLALGGLAGAAVLRETFATTGTAPPRTQLAPTLGFAGAAAVRVTDAVELAADLELATYVLRRDAMAGSPRWTTPLTARLVLGVGVAW